MDRDELRELHEALLSAFPERSGLAQLVTYEFDTPLDAISSPNDNLVDTILHLIQWAQARNLLDRLAAAAVRQVPGNAKLKAFVANRAERAARSGAVDRTSPMPPFVSPQTQASTAPRTGDREMRLLIIGTFCVASLLMIAMVFFFVLFGVLNAAHLWVSVIPVVLLAAVAFRVSPPAGVTYS